MCTIYTLFLLILLTCVVLGDEIGVVTSEEYVLVPEGGVANLSCTTDQEWFFCLWRHPSGVKECIVQENGTYASACTGMEYLEIQGSDKTCSLLLDNISIQDHGVYMCLFNQAEIFNTARTFVHLEVATPAEVVLDDGGEVLELAEGEIREIQCSAERAFPAPEFIWTIGGEMIVPLQEVTCLLICIISCLILNILDPPPPTRQSYIPLSVHY